MIYIACPEKYATGGTELLHQLFFKIKKHTNNVRIFYFDYSGTSNPTNERFKKYEVEYVAASEDSEKNILIVPEVATLLLRKYSKITKSVWWLSVDNYYQSIGNDKNFPKMIIKKFRLMKRNRTLHLGFNFKDDKIIHLYQSYYAESFLNNKHVNQKTYLSDYIGSNFLAVNAKFVSCERENVVLYNPSKGIEFTKKLIEYDNEIKYIPLVNMSQEEIVSLCQKAKVYIDFGNHPGKDRFPREAAYLGCIVITGLKGSAKFENDVYIPDSYKFKDKKSVIGIIVDKIKYVFTDYDHLINDFGPYRMKTKLEEHDFENDVKKVMDNYLYKYTRD